MYGTIEVPKEFYDYGKKGKAAVAARWALKTAMRAAVEVEKKAAKQAVAQQAKAEAAAKVAKAAVKAIKRAAKKTEKSTAAEQSELAKEKTEKAVGDKTTKQKVAVQVRHSYRHSAPPPGSVTSKARALPWNAILHQCLLSGALTHSLWPPGIGDLVASVVWWSGVASEPRNSFRNCRLSGSEIMRFVLRRHSGFPHLTYQAKKVPSFHGVVSIFLPVLMLLSAVGLRYSGSG